MLQDTSRIVLHRRTNILITWSHSRFFRKLNRDICVRSDGDLDTCYRAFDAALKQLDSLREGKYTGAASLLALLLTIGALLGATTAEVWRPLTSSFI